MKTLITFFFVSLFVSPVTFAANELESYVKKNLQGQKSLTGRFEQKRHLKDVGMTLVSSGQFQLDQQKGLNWQQETPFVFLMTLDRAQLVLKVEKDTPKVVTAEQDPVVFGFSKVFLALFQGDWALLEGYFSMQIEGTQEKWTAILTTKSDPLKKAIDRLEVRGSKYVEQIDVFEKKGDRLEIHFSKLK